MLTANEKNTPNAKEVKENTSFKNILYTNIYI